MVAAGARGTISIRWVVFLGVVGASGCPRERPARRKAAPAEARARAAPVEDAGDSPATDGGRARGLEATEWLVRIDDGPYRSMDRVAGGAAITGRVTWSGPRPSLVPVVITRDRHACGHETRSSSRLLVGSGGGVKDAVIWLDQPKRGKRLVPLPSPAVIDQLRCEFVPRVLVVPVGTELEIVNSDETFHNVHAYRGTETVFNIGQPHRGMRRRVPLNAPGLLELVCDAGHTWMNAHLFVTSHPYFAITDAQGRFALTDVVPGSYTLRMWHEGWNVLRALPDGRPEVEPPHLSEQPVTVSPGGKITVEFSLSTEQTSR